MPKSRHRKNHKKKVESWKQRTQQKVNSANKENIFPNHINGKVVVKFVVNCEGKAVNFEVLNTLLSH